MLYLVFWGGALGGVKNYYLGKPVWKGAVAGGAGAAVPAFFGIYGYVGAFVGGGISSGTSSGLDRNSAARVMADTLGGAALSTIMYGVADFTVGNYIDTKLIGLSPQDTEYISKLFQPVAGSVAGNIWSVISHLINRDYEKK